MNTENNKLLAEFMGVFDKILSTQNIHSWSDAPFYYTTENSKEKVIENISNYVKYDTDWNWLMEVTQKIDAVCGIDLHEWDEHINNALCSKSLHTTYNACVEFVQWYNKNK
jgi:hypothetical protein